MIRERPGNLTRIFAILAPILLIGFAVMFDMVLRKIVGGYVQRVAIDCCIAITMAVSLNIVNGFTGQFSIGHAAFFAIGAYVSGGITYYASIGLWDSPAAWGDILHSPSLQVFQQSLIYFLAMIAGGLIAAIAGWLVGLPSLRLRGDYLAIVTLGFGEIVRNLLQLTNAQRFSQKEIADAKWSELIPPPVGGALGFINIPKMTTLFWAALAAAACVVFAWRLKKSTFGRAMIAIRENEIAAEAMGVNITRLKVWAFIFAAFFAGIAGGVYAHEPGIQIGPDDSGFAISFDIVIMVVLGGLGSITGSVLAAVSLTLVNEYLREYGSYRMIIYALILILMMIVRPNGLFGTRELLDFWRRKKKSKDSGFEVIH